MLIRPRRAVPDRRACRRSEPSSTAFGRPEVPEVKQTRPTVSAAVRGDGSGRPGSGSCCSHADWTPSDRTCGGRDPRRLPVGDHRHEAVQGGDLGLEAIGEGHRARPEPHQCEQHHPVAERPLDVEPDELARSDPRPEQMAGDALDVVEEPLVGQMVPPVVDRHRVRIERPAGMEDLRQVHRGPFGAAAAGGGSREEGRAGGSRPGPEGSSAFRSRGTMRPASARPRRRPVPRDRRRTPSRAPFAPAASGARSG